MGFTHPSFLRVSALVTAAAITASLLIGVAPAQADTAPPSPATPETVSSDPLPTVQIDGVVWSQTIVGDTVFVGGNFQNAQPAGTAAGVGQIPRTHLLAYNIRTGALITSFAPTLNGQVRVVTASPDGKRLYVGGEFTVVNGVSRSRVAAFDVATGTLISTFRPAANTRVYAIAATNSVVYLGGWFSAVSNVPRTNAAAVSASTGAVLPFAPAISGGTVSSLLVSPDASKVIIGGSFTTMNGVGGAPGRDGVTGNGLGAVDATSGSGLPFAVNSIIHNGGPDSAITSLAGDADSVYGTGYHYGAGGNLEGTFRADWNGGNLQWIEDCHGDSYSVSPQGSSIYVVGHPHYCSNVDAFPQTEPDWTFQRAMAWTKDVKGTITRDQKGYFNFEGNPRPEVLNWWPDLISGSFTGMGQAAWSVASTAEYVVLGGEFPGVNNKRQQGLVRFAVKSIAPNKDGPRLSGANFVPAVKSLTAGSVRMSWPANYDRDNTSLTYNVIRDGNTASPVYTTTASSRIWFDRPQLSFTETGLTPGQTYTYRLRATDPFGNTVLGDPVSIVVSSEGMSEPYSTGILDSDPTAYYRLGEASGTVNDYAGFNDAQTNGAVIRSQTGAIVGSSDSAMTFDGTSSFVASQTAVAGPNTFSVSAWFKTTTTAGGKIVGFGNAKTGSSNRYDRHVYMDNAGKLLFGAYPGTTRTVVSADSYNDGQWHQAVATLGANGMNLYVDGIRVGQRTDTTSGESYSGYWRIGGDTSWTASNYFAGSIDEVAIYSKVLTQSAIVDQYGLSGRTASVVAAPTDPYGAEIYRESPEIYWRLGESSGTNARDSSAANRTGTYSAGVIKQTAGAVAGTSDTSSRFNGSTGVVVQQKRVDAPQVYSLEAWFSTTSTQGGRILGFGSNSAGASATSDRQVYMDDSGRVAVGASGLSASLVKSTIALNDGAWHHVVATQTSAGISLYIDGRLVGTTPTRITTAYTGYWRAGGETTGDSTSGFFNGRIDEVAVYSLGLLESDVADHYRLGTGTVPNVAPTAAFTSSATDLDASFDAATSTDSDGSISDYAWNFGDGSTGSGVTTTHRYAVAGAYTVTLIVTDDDGAIASTAGTVIAAAPNVAPVAAFDTTTTNLRASVTAATSTDSDGSIVGYAWNFGDGATATGVTAAHDYAAAGTFTVTLTVTDDDGATATTASAVTVTAPDPAAALAQDAFARTTVNGLGTADTGGAWTVTGAATNYAVSSGVGSIRVPNAGSTLSQYLTGVSSSDTEVRATIALQNAASGTGFYGSVIARRVGVDAYTARVRVLSTGAVYTQLMRGSTTLQSVLVPGLTYATGDRLNLKVQAVGTSPTQLKATVWKVGTAEPTAWQTSVSDTFAALQQPGHVGLSMYLASSATVFPLTVTVDDFWAGSSASGGPVVLPPANVAPTAVFTSSATDLTASFSGATSSDTDGTIASYAWAFGDGASASGSTPSHGYAAAGTYPVTLTVTDDDGATGTATQNVTVTAPPGPVAPALARDAFERTSASGWGAAEIGGTWAVAGSAANYTVGAGTGAQATAPGSTLSTALTSVSTTSADTRVTVAIDKAASGGGTFLIVNGRKIGTVSYAAKAKISSTGAVSVQLLAAATVLQTLVIPGLTYVPGDVLAVRLQVTGTSPTTLTAKVWRATDVEPTSWQVSATDSTAGLQAAGYVGLSTFVSGSSTGGIVTSRWNDLVVSTP